MSEDFQIDLGDLIPHTSYRADEDEGNICPECDGWKNYNAEYCDDCQDELDEDEDDAS